MDANQGPFKEYFVGGRSDVAPNSGAFTQDQINPGKTVIVLSGHGG